MKFLFIDVPEVKIKVGHCCLSGIAQGYNILYDRGTKLLMSFTMANELKEGEPDDTFPRTRYERNRR